jgi:hypothetical protein
VKTEDTGRGLTMGVGAIAVVALLLGVLAFTANGDIVAGSTGGGGGGVTPNSCTSGEYANGISDSSGTLICAQVQLTQVVGTTSCSPGEFAISLSDGAFTCGSAAGPADIVYNITQGAQTVTGKVDFVNSTSIGVDISGQDVYFKLNTATCSSGEYVTGIANDPEITCAQVLVSQIGGFVYSTCVGNQYAYGNTSSGTDCRDFLYETCSSGEFVTGNESSGFKCATPPAPTYNYADCPSDEYVYGNESEGFLCQQVTTAQVANWAYETCSSNEFIYGNESSGFKCSSVPWAALSAYPSGCPTNEYVSAVGLTLTCVQVPIGPFTWRISVVGTEFYAYNETNYLVYSGTTASTVINDVLSHFGGGDGSIAFGPGTYPLTSELLLPDVGGGQFIGAGEDATYFTGTLATPLIGWTTPTDVHARWLFSSFDVEGKNTAGGPVTDLHQTEISAQLTINEVLVSNTATSGTETAISLSGDEDTITTHDIFTNAGGTPAVVWSIPSGYAADYNSFWNGATMAAQAFAFYGTVVGDNAISPIGLNLYNTGQAASLYSLYSVYFNGPIGTSPITVSQTGADTGSVELLLDNAEVGNVNALEPVVHDATSGAVAIGLVIDGGYYVNSAGTEAFTDSSNYKWQSGYPPYLTGFTMPTASLNQATVPWAGITNFPSGCSSGYFVTAVGATLTCAQASWAQLTNFPSACSSGYFVTGVGSSLTCTQVSWSNLTNFPSACSAGEYVSAVGSGGLTCGTPSGTAYTAAFYGLGETDGATTTYFTLDGLNVATAVSSVYIPWPTAGTMKDLSCVESTTFAHSVTWYLVTGTTPTQSALTISEASVTGGTVYTDSVHSVTVTAGELLAFSVVLGSSGGFATSCSVQFTS